MRRRVVQVALEAELAVVVERLQAASEVAVAAEDTVLPGARTAMAAVETGYREGKFGFVDVIAAQRTFFEASTLLVDSLEEYVLARTEKERLVGASSDHTGGLPAERENDDEISQIDAYTSQSVCSQSRCSAWGPAVAPRNSMPPNTARRMDTPKAS